MAGGKGHGCSPFLGRKTFINELVVEVNSSTGARNQGPSFVRRSPVSSRMEASVSNLENTVGDVTPYGVPEEGIPIDRGSSMGTGGLEVVYHIDGKEFTKEEWLQL